MTPHPLTGCWRGEAWCCPKAPQRDEADGRKRCDRSNFVLDLRLLHVLGDNIQINFVKGLWRGDVGLVHVIGSS